VRQGIIRRQSPDVKWDINNKKQESTQQYYKSTQRRHKTPGNQRGQTTRRGSDGKGRRRPHANP